MEEMNGNDLQEVARLRWPRQHMRTRQQAPESTDIGNISKKNPKVVVFKMRDLTLANQALSTKGENKVTEGWSTRGQVRVARHSWI